MQEMVLVAYGLAGWATAKLTDSERPSVLLIGGSGLIMVWFFWVLASSSSGPWTLEVAKAGAYMLGLAAGWTRSEGREVG